MLKIHKWLQWPLWPPTMVQKSLFLSLFLPHFIRKLIKGGNYSREETIQGRKAVSKGASNGRKLFKGGNYIRADTILGNTVSGHSRH